MTSMIVVSTVVTGTSATGLLSIVSGGRFFLAGDFFVLMPALWTLDFVFFGVGCFVAILLAGLVLALPRFELFLRTATRFFAFAMAISCEIMLPARQRYVALFRNDSPLGTPQKLMGQKANRPGCNTGRVEL